MHPEFSDSFLAKPLIDSSASSLASLSAAPILAAWQEEYYRSPDSNSNCKDSMSLIRSRSPAVPTREGTPEELSSLTEATSSSPAAESEATGKRKEHPKASSSRFKMVGNVVLAMQRFQASLNPTVTFGSGPSRPGGSTSSSQDAIAPASQLNTDATSSPLSPRDAAGSSKVRKLQSRNRFATMMQPLPPVDI